MNFSENLQRAFLWQSYIKKQTSSIWHRLLFLFLIYLLFFVISQSHDVGKIFSLVSVWIFSTIRQFTVSREPKPFRDCWISTAHFVTQKSGILRFCRFCEYGWEWTEHSNRKKRIKLWCGKCILLLFRLKQISKQRRQRMNGTHKCSRLCKNIHFWKLVFSMKIHRFSWHICKYLIMNEWCK